MEKRGFSIVQDRNRSLHQQRAPVLKVPQVQPDPRTVIATPPPAPPTNTENKVVIVQNFYQESAPPCEVAYYPPPIPRGLCPPPFAPPFAFYPSPCSMNQPRPFCFR